MRTRRRLQAKRTLILAFLLCLFIFSLLAETFVLAKSGHEHDNLGAGGECDVCAQIHNIDSLRAHFKDIVSAGAAALLCLFASLMLLCAFFVYANHTPITLKTRLNN